ncbi:hypothetical protein GCM10010245_54480 [Streptomyces spectabilis]|nr:hypothetical protein GCM10010245_54480 [Streptomyces spectabilis]
MPDPLVGTEALSWDRADEPLESRAARPAPALPRGPAVSRRSKKVPSVTRRRRGVWLQTGYLTRDLPSSAIHYGGVAP